MKELTADLEISFIFFLFFPQAIFLYFDNLQQMYTIYAKYNGCSGMHL